MVYAAAASSRAARVSASWRQGMSVRNRIPGLNSAVGGSTSPVADGAGNDVLTIVGNLVDNAVDATGTGGSVTVFLHSTTEDGVRLRVADDGPGVPEELRDRIFDTGVTTKSPGVEHHGRGIGLALVSRIVRRRGGTISVTDGPGGGSVFIVTLPAQPVPHPSDDRVASNEVRW